MPSTSPRILVVEDDEVIRAALEEALTGVGFEVRCEASGVMIDQVARSFSPDLAVLDLRLQEGPNGYDLAKRLRTTSDMPVLFLSAYDRLEHRLAGFEAGGDDYMVKPFAMAELIARAHALLRRSGRPSLDKLIVGDLVLNPADNTVTRNGASIDLTQVEFDLLWALASHPGRMFSRTQLLSQVWGFTSYGANLVEVRISALRQKLEKHGPRVIHTVRGKGYVFHT